MCQPKARSRAMPQGLVLSSYLTYAPAIIIPRLVSAAIILVFARFLSPEEIGYYSLVIIIGEYLDAVFVRWIRVGYARLYYSFSQKGIGIDATVLLLMVPGLVFSVIFGFGYVIFSPDMGVKWAALLSLYVVSNFILQTGLQFLRVRGQSGPYLIIEAGRSLFGFLLALLLTYALGPDYGLLLIGTQTLTFAAAAWLLWRMITEDRRKRFDRASMIEIARYSLPLLVTFGLAGTAIMLDRILLEWLMGPALLGIYAVSYQLARPIVDILFNAVNLVGFPKLVRAYENDGDIGAQKELYHKNVTMAILTMPVVAFMLVSSTIISDVILVKDYATFAPITIQIIVVATFLRGWTNFMINQIFLLRKTPIDTAYSIILGIAAIVAAGFLLIPHFGIYGAALSALIGAVVETAVAYALAMRRMRFRAFGVEIIKIAVACAFGGALIWLGIDLFGVAGWLFASVGVLSGYAYFLRKSGLHIFLKDGS